MQPKPNLKVNSGEVIAENVVIANGASLSSAFEMGGAKTMAVLWPAAWTAAVATFAGCLTSDGTFVPIYNDRGEEATITSVTAATGTSLDYLCMVLAPWPYVKIRSGTSAAAVNQLAERTISIICKG